MLNLLSFAKLRFLENFIMNKLIQQIEKGKPFFEKISRFGWKDFEFPVF